VNKTLVSDIGTTQQLHELQIANTVDNARFKSQYCVYAQLKKGSLYSLEVEAETGYTQNGYNFLLTIPPAGIEPKRAFSTAGNGILCSKLRSRMTDAVWTLDNMLFVRT